MDFVDNQEVVETLANKPLNCFALMDEESRFPQVEMLLTLKSIIYLLRKMNVRYTLYPLNKNPYYPANASRPEIRLLSEANPKPSKVQDSSCYHSCEVFLFLVQVIRKRCKQEFSFFVTQSCYTN